MAQCGSVSSGGHTESSEDVTETDNASSRPGRAPMSPRLREASAARDSANAARDSADELSGLPDPETPEGKRLLRKAIVAVAIGNATEWYDYGVYATVATYLADAFFPGPLGSIGAMLGFAVSFVLRPLGGMV